MSFVAQLQPTLYVGTFIHTPSRDKLTIHPQSAVGVDKEGKIVFIDHDLPSTVQPADIAAQHGWSNMSFKTVRADSGANKSTFFFPGFIDTHTHAPQYPNTGIFGSSTLLDWLNMYTFPMESSFSSLSRAKVVYNRVVARGLANGTTTAAYHATLHVSATNLLADVCFARGQRALVGRVCMDRETPEWYRDESPKAALEATKECIAHAESIDPSGTIVRPVITPRFAPTCTDETLKLLGDLHQESGHFAQTHISENTAEILMVKRLFPQSKHYTEVYDTAGLLSRKTILAHAIHLSDDEIFLIAQRKSGVSHCPVSNICLTSGRCPVRKLLDAGVMVGLGTDMSGGYSPSILETARQALGSSRHIAMYMEEGPAKERTKLSVADALWLATKGGAEVVNLEDRVGSFEVGMDWDAQMISLDIVSDESNLVDVEDTVQRGGPVDVFDWQQSWEDRIAKWLYCGDDRNVSAVWVRGRLVHARQ